MVTDHDFLLNISKKRKLKKRRKNTSKQKKTKSVQNQKKTKQNWSYVPERQTKNQLKTKENGYMCIKAIKWL